mgnify:CR=1 FL=1
MVLLAEAPAIGADTPQWLRVGDVLRLTNMKPQTLYGQLSRGKYESRIDPDTGLKEMLISQVTLAEITRPDDDTAHPGEEEPETTSAALNSELVDRVLMLSDRVMEYSERIVQLETDAVEKSRTIEILNREIETRNTALVRLRQSDEAPVSTGPSARRGRQRHVSANAGFFGRLLDTLCK